MSLAIPAGFIWPNVDAPRQCPASWANNHSRPRSAGAYDNIKNIYVTSFDKNVFGLVGISLELMFLNKLYKIHSGLLFSIAY